MCEKFWTLPPSFRLHHIGYLAADLSKAAEAFALLGYEKASSCRDESRGIDILFLKNRESVLVELIKPCAEKNPVGNLLKKRGPGPYHLCFATNERMEQVAGSLMAIGFIPLGNAEIAPAIDNKPVMFFMPIP